MRELYYRLLGRRNYLLKAILITGLILLGSFIIVLLPQLVSPHILSTYLDGLSGGNIEINQDEYFALDIKLSGATFDPSFIDDFNQTVKTASEKVYGMYQPKSLNLFAQQYAHYLNETYGNQTPTPYVAFLFGVSTSFFESIKPYTEHGLHSAEVILLTNQPNETFSSFNISIHNVNTTIQHDDTLSTEVFTEHFPYSSKSLLRKITTLYGNGSVTVAPCFLYQIDDFSSRFDPYLQEFYEGYSITGFISFEDEQKEIMSWIIDANTKIKNFEKEIVKMVQLSSATTRLEFLGAHLFGDEFLINMVYSFMRGLQITFWGLGLIITCLTFSKIQERNKEKEQRALIAGQKWSKRIGNLLVESFLIGVGGMGIALALFYPIVKLQTLFNIDLSINAKTILEVSIITLVLIIVIFSVYIDFELYLRKTLIRLEEKYKLFKTIPKYLYSVPIILVFLLVWLLNRNIISIVIFAVFVIITLGIALAVTYLLRLIIGIGKRLNEYQKRRQKTPLSPFDALLKLWNKQLLSKLLLFSFLVSIVSVVFLYANFSADFQKTDLLWMNGGEIDFNGANLDTAIIDQELEAIQEIEKYVKVIRFSNFVNETDRYILGVVGSTIKPVFGNYTGEKNINIYALNSSSFYDYYESWGMKNWVAPGQITELKNNTCFVNHGFEMIGFEKDDTLQLFNSSQPMQIKGYVNTLPGMGGFSSNFLTLIVDYELLLQLLMDYEAEYIIDYHLRCEEQFIDTVVEKLVPLLDSTGIDEIDYMDTTIATGVRIVFLKPIIVVFQLFIILWGAFYLYSNIDDINQSTEAKNLGIIAMIGNYRKPLRNFKMLEGVLQFSAFLMIFGVIYVFSSLLIPLFWGSDMTFRIMVTSDTWLNLAFLLIAYPLLLVIQGIAEYLKYRTIDLSVIYRHPE